MSQTHEDEGCTDQARRLLAVMADSKSLHSMENQGLAGASSVPVFDQAVEMLIGADTFT